MDIEGGKGRIEGIRRILFVFFVFYVFVWLEIFIDKVWSVMMSFIGLCL